MNDRRPISHMSLKQLPTILLVDDDEALLTTTSALLGSDFDVTAVSSGRAALAALRRSSIDVVCADQSMPGMTGTELLERVAEEHPGMGRLLLTGMSEYFEERDAEGPSGFAVVLKPYDPPRLQRVLWQQARISRMRRAVADLRGHVPGTKGE